MTISGKMNLTGRWKGTKQLYFKPDDTPYESKSTLVITPVGKGAFHQLTYSWSYEGKDHEGTILLCVREANNNATAAWGDSFHQSGSIMHLEGAVDEGGNIDVLGAYAAPPGPDWGWRIKVQSIDDGTLALTMYNIWPEGQEDIAVKILYRRA